MALKVLLIEDEDLIREVIMINLTRAGFDVYQSGNGEDGIDKFNSIKPNIVLLDINLPGIDGFEVCRRIREKDKSAGIIMLTARSQEIDRIGGLRSGADDYVTKPFSPGELVARVEALSRRLDLNSTDSPRATVASGPFILDTVNRGLMKNGEEIDITHVEYLILDYMIENEGRILTRQDIFEHVWQQPDGELKVVDVNIRRLRMKIEDDPSSPGYLQTVWGTGYMWSATGSRLRHLNEN